mmetsp:Transcript_31237/g.90220  ORF Transcript_31237/g.90220 Transcript_31237/m.90220 type:complete len:472 (+) Transcript_31237:100-1515(+)
MGKAKELLEMQAQNLASANSDSASVEAALGEHSHMILVATERIAELRPQLAQLQASLQGLQPLAEELRARSREARAEVEARRSDLAELDAQADEAWVQSASVQQKLRRLQATAASLAVARAATALPGLGSSSSSAAPALAAASPSDAQEQQQQQRPPEQLGLGSARPTLAGLAAEAGALAAEDLQFLRSQLAASRANIDAAVGERLRLEQERKVWAEQLGTLREAHQTLLEKQGLAKETLRQTRCEVESLQPRRALARAQFYEVAALRRHLEDEHARVHEATHSGRGCIESLQGETWKELRTTKQVFEQNAEGIHCAASAHEEMRKQVINLATAHSKRSLSFRAAGPIAPAPTPPAPAPGAGTGTSVLFGQRDGPGSAAHRERPTCHFEPPTARGGGPTVSPLPGVAGAKPAAPLPRPVGVSKVAAHSAAICAVGLQHQQPLSARAPRASGLGGAGQLVLSGGTAAGGGAG